ncbi:MAG TPA: hypothetical protein VLM20_00490 [Methylophilaceae bacterium]|nr:hypothetical protein [Methylophilaceae bacterium]
MLAKAAKSIKWALMFLIIPIGLFALYTWVVLSWSYSSGERAGYVQKLSQKGFLCKTYEGELILVSMPGTQAEKFYFTVKDPKIAQKINETVGKRVRLTYEQHIGVPSSCFGETSYYVNDVKVVKEKLIDQEMFPQ